MQYLSVVLLACLSSSLCFGQTPSSSQPYSSSKYRPAHVMAAKVHQPTGDEDSRTLRYDVTVHVADMEYVVLYTPPNGIDVVEYKLGHDGLVLVGVDSIKWHDILGRPHEAPILLRRAIPSKTKQ
jgi:hypothetical protein